MTFAFVKYWVEGTKEAVQQLCEAIEKADGWAEKALKNLGVNTEEYETGRVEWHNAKVEDKDGYSVLYFEEYYPYERGTLIDQLMEEGMFEGQLIALYYYAEELANADLCETNDAEGKYFPERLMAGVVDDSGFYVDDEPVYKKDEQELMDFLRNKYQLPATLKDLDDFKSYFEESDSYECLVVQEINIVS